MRNIVFVWEDNTGAVRITYPVWSNKKPHETDDSFLERVTKKLPNPIAMRPEALPKDRNTRHLWRLWEGKIIVVRGLEAGEVE